MEDFSKVGDAIGDAYEEGYKQGAEAVITDLKGLLEGYEHKQENITLYEYYCKKYGIKPKHNED